MREDKENEIVEHLKETYDPIAIVLTGSRVSGKASSNSDWDFYVFTSEMRKDGLNSYKGETLDVTVVNYPVGENYILSTRYHPEQHIKVVFDKSGGWIGDIVKRTQEKYEKEPEELPQEEYERLKKVMARYIEKSEGRKEVEGLPFYYLGIFYEIAIRLWFQLKKEWPLPPYEALPHIQKRDLAFYRNLATIYGSGDVDEKIGAARDMYWTLFTR